MASLTIVIGVFSQKFGSGKKPILLVKMDADCLGGGELKGILRHPLLADNSWQQMTPRDEFSDLWMETCTGLSMNRVVVRRPTACDFLVYSTRKEPSLNLLMLLRVLAIAWNPFWITKGDSLLRGRSSLDDSTTRNHGQLLLVLQKCSLLESVSESWSLFHNLLFLFEGAMLCLFMIRYTLSPPATESNKGMHTSGNSSKRAPGLKT